MAAHIARNRVHRALAPLAEPERAAALQRFFKTGPGEYGEGDRFLGLTVPVIRKAVRDFRELTLEEIADLLTSAWHEERLLALLVLVDRYARGNEGERAQIYRLYLASSARINSWDLVDVSAAKIVGLHLEQRDRRVLDRLARSELIWDRRIAIIATQHFIRLRQFDDTLRIAERLLRDGHDLIHKAVGWMLREVGNRDRAVEEQFLDRFAAQMPRTMLRYAIEKFPEGRRKAYMRMGR